MPKDSTKCEKKQDNPDITISDNGCSINTSDVESICNEQTKEEKKKNLLYELQKASAELEKTLNREKKDDKQECKTNDDKSLGCMSQISIQASDCKSNGMSNESQQSYLVTTLSDVKADMNKMLKYICSLDKQTNSTKNRTVYLKNEIEQLRKGLDKSVCVDATVKNTACSKNTCSTDTCSTDTCSTDTCSTSSSTNSCSTNSSSTNSCSTDSSTNSCSTGSTNSCSTKSKLCDTLSYKSCNSSNSGKSMLSKSIMSDCSAFTGPCCDCPRCCRDNLTDDMCSRDTCSQYSCATKNSTCSTQTACSYDEFHKFKTEVLHMLHDLAKQVNDQMGMMSNIMSTIAIARKPSIPRHN